MLVSGDGLGAAAARARGETYARLASAGCTVSELPGATRGRGWGAAAGVRIAAGLGAVTVLVEAEDRPWDLRGARLARALGRGVAAVPGPVGSRASAGCHLLLRDGARLVRGASDVLDLLYGVDAAGATDPVPAAALPGAVLPRLRPALRELLKRVAAGTDTLGKLTAGPGDRAQVLCDLSELELTGLLSRGDGGRYVLGDAGTRQT